MIEGTQERSMPLHVLVSVEGATSFDPEPRAAQLLRDNALVRGGFYIPQPRRLEELGCSYSHNMIEL